MSPACTQPHPPPRHARPGDRRRRQGQEEQLGALGLVVNCIVLYNTIYTQRALDQLAAEGYEVLRDDIRRLSPLGYEHITLTGRYHLILADPIRRGEYRPLKTPRAPRPGERLGRFSVPTIP